MFCHICGSSRIEKFNGYFFPFISMRVFGINRKDTKLLHCKDCGFYYAEIRPTSEQMEFLYSGYRGEEYQKQRQSFEPEYTKEFNALLGGKESERSRKDGIFSIVSKFFPSEKIHYILDYGGDRGQFFPEQYATSHRFVYDISGVKTIDGVEGLACAEKLDKYPWNLILCCHVLEHLSSPREELKKIFNIMPIDSYLYVEVPCEDYFYSYIYKDEPVPIHEHINFFTESSLYALFSEPTLVILELCNDNSNLKVLVKKVKNEDVLYKHLYFNIYNLQKKIEKLGPVTETMPLLGLSEIESIKEYKILLNDIKKYNIKIEEYIKRYPRWMINLLACFIPNQKNRHFLRKKYSR